MVYRQYDHQVQTNTVVGPGSDAAVLRIKGTGKAIALCIDGNGRYCYLDPYRGGEIAVAEVCRNLSCVGAEPLALTDGLNFGNPEKPEVYYQMEWCIRGMARACRVLGIPVVSGNVSLYNESRGQAIYPTPIVGGLGLLEEAARHATSAFSQEGLLVALLGSHGWSTKATDLAGSEYLKVVHDLVAGRPAIDLTLESQVQALCRRAIREGLITSAHDCADGGLAVALAECCINPSISPLAQGGLPGGVGFQGDFDLPRRWDVALFGERQSRIVVSLHPHQWPQLEHLAAEAGVPILQLGTTGGHRFRLGPYIDLAVAEISDAWSHGLERALH
jgi:phosphoribosylformylglycinamidine synthase